MDEKILKRIRNDERFLEVAKHDKKENLLVTGVNEDFKATLLYQLYEMNKRPYVIFVQNNHQMEKLAAVLMDLMEDNVYTFPVGDIMIENHSKQSPEFIKSRMAAGYALAHNVPGLFLVPVHALMKPLMTKEKLLDYQQSFEIGGKVDYEALIGDLVSLGYKRMTKAQNVGEFAEIGRAHV